MEHDGPQKMNGNVQVSQSQSSIHTLSMKQRVFIAVLLLLGLLLSFMVVRFLDPAAALTSQAASAATHSTKEGAVVLA
jgi:D-alanyl-lipoteichoic acid acyltransferase DltB (MBOAT superfamily)